MECNYLSMPNFSGNFSIAAVEVSIGYGWKIISCIMEQVTAGFSLQRASNVESFPCHDGIILCLFWNWLNDSSDVYNSPRLYPYNINFMPVPQFKISPRVLKFRCLTQTRRLPLFIHSWHLSLIREWVLVSPMAGILMGLSASVVIIKALSQILSDHKLNF